MKLKLALLVTPIIASIASIATGATVLSSNYNGSDSSVVVNLSNTQVAGGYAALGYFSITDAAILTSSASQLSTAFQLFGASGGTSYDVGGGYIMNGAFDLAPSQALSAASAFVGKNVYLVVGNGATLGNSTQAFIYKTNSLFAADPASPFSVDFTAGAPAGGTAILGQTGVTFTPQYSGAGTIDGNQVATAYKMGLITAVPEPSAALLGVVGALGLLRRRRI